MKQTISTVGRLAVTSTALLGGVVLAQADEGSRANKWELYGFGQYLTSGTATTTVGGIPAGASLDSVFGGGIGFGYNLSEHFNWNLDAGWGSGDLGVTAPGVSTSVGITVISANTSVDWNILSGPITPFLTVNVGLLHFSSGAVSGGETDYAFGGGGGLRWDINDQWFMKATYRVNWTQFAGFDDYTMVHLVTLGIGYKF